jgi:mono/diheme cytochrome c family protein
MVPLIILVFLVGLVAVAVSAPPSGKITIKVGGAKDATFDHPAHVKIAGGKCATCHHKDAAGKEQKCTNCHTKDGKDGASAGKEMFHKKCGGCHKEQAKGPLFPKDCKVCHAAN